ncbi:MAG: HD-GYP domain-containing protein [bacterium]
MDRKYTFRVGDLSPGTVFDSPLYTVEGLKLADEFTVLNSERLERLKNWEIKKITSTGQPLTDREKEKIKEAADKGRQKLREASSGENLADRVDHSAVEEAKFYDLVDKKQVRRAYFRTLENTEKLLDKLSNTGISQLKEIRATLRPLYNSIWNYQMLLLYFISDQGLEDTDYIYRYSLNTSILSMIIADQIGYSQEEIRTVGMGGLVHDTGMLRLPRKIRVKQDKLSDLEKKTMQKHVNKGIRGLPSLEGVGNSISSVITQHHENYDGSGYPKGLAGDEIHPHARIVNLAMTYIAMTQPRYHRQEYGVQHSIREVIYREKQKFDPVVLKGFIKVMGIYPPGSLIKISSGHHALVMKTTPGRPLSPVVRVLTDAEGNKLDSPYRLQLSEENTTVDQTLNKSDYNIQAFDLV